MSTTHVPAVCVGWRRSNADKLAEELSPLVLAFEIEGEDGKDIIYKLNEALFDMALRKGNEMYPDFFEEMNFDEDDYNFNQNLEGCAELGIHIQKKRLKLKDHIKLLEITEEIIKSFANSAELPEVEVFSVDNSF